MGYDVSKLEVWSGTIDDRAGGLAAKLEPLAAAGADLQFVIARRQPQLPGTGVVFLSGVSGPKVTKAAEAAGLRKTTDLAAIRVEAPNKPGDCHAVTRKVADAGLNLRGLTASVIGDRYVIFLAFDNAADADRAAKLLST